VHNHMATEFLPAFDISHGEDMTWWSLDAALRTMDENDIRVAILSPMQTPLKDRSASMRGEIRRVNEQVAAIAASRPDRFTFFASANLLNADDAVAEASYGLDCLGAAGILMFTNIGNSYLGDPVFEPLLAELNRRGAVVFVHPLQLPCPLVSGIPGHVCDFLQSTVRAATNLVQKGVTRRYGRLRFILCHGGGYIPYAIQRLSRGLAATHPDRSAEDYLEDYRQFYYDTALAVAPATLSALLAFSRAGHVLYGTDFPFSQPDEIAFLTRQFESLDLDTGCRRAIDHENAVSLFPRLKMDP
jgi:6-methylsalicylate decarboxylase